MNSPELLLLVENCPKGAETLVTRCLHSLTDKGDSGDGGGDGGGKWGSREGNGRGIEDGKGGAGVAAGWG